ncbi:MAG: IS110 family transposase [Moorea sp. SIO4E2]|uniref:IS110 family transposase n=1 Tax=Moorena sp. SIO4E2 TaxID=2607826 RepID=UPI0013BDC12B|nr:IS110 family transposase [Moorena sp. SIO4E2]NEQ11772.1 IS110 family transposase [Moorena sp. SIO4E2]
MRSKAVGIDISKDKFDVALYDTETYQEAVFTNDKKGFRSLYNWLKKMKARDAVICMEATGRHAEAAAMYLYERGVSVSIVNPARIKAYRESQLKRNKTDREDAKAIAHFAITQDFSLWTPPPPEVQELQALVRRLKTLKEERTRETNRKKSIVTSKAVLKSIEKHIKFINEQINQIEKQIEDLFDQHPDLKEQKELLESIPGIGPVTAANFIAEVGDIKRFESAKQLAAYAGLTPRWYQSGTSVNKPGRLSKRGNIRLRTVFYMAAMAAIRSNPFVISLATRMEKQGKSRMSIIGASMRKLVHLAYGVLKNQQPFDPHHLDNMLDIA